MKKASFIFLLLSFLGTASPLHAQLDLEQEVLVIPDTHNAKPYIWDVRRNPRGYALLMDPEGIAAGRESNISFSVDGPGTEGILEMHVFVTDRDLHTYRHVRPERTANGWYTFSLDLQPGRNRFETVFRTGKGWINLSRDMEVRGDGRQPVHRATPGDEEYDVKVKVIPKTLYTDHAVTFLFELAYKGMPLQGLEKAGGADIEVASWDEDLKEFVYAVPAQNLGGPRVAVSMVFMRAGKRAVFAEFRHLGVTRMIEFVIDVRDEPKDDPDAIENIQPAS